MYELVYKNGIKLDYCEQNVNGIPTPFEIITEDKWRELRHKWHNDYYSYEQIHLKDQLQQLFNVDSGYAEAYIDYNNEYAVAEIIKKFWQDREMKQQRVYVKIGCNHEWELIDENRLSYTHKCKKCGTIIETPTGV